MLLLLGAGELLLDGLEVELLPPPEELREGELVPPSVELLRVGVVVLGVSLLDGREGVVVLGVDVREGVVGVVLPRVGAVVAEPVRPFSVFPSVVFPERIGVELVRVGVLVFTFVPFVLFVPLRGVFTTGRPDVALLLLL